MITTLAWFFVVSTFPVISSDGGVSEDQPVNFSISKSVMSDPWIGFPQAYDLFLKHKIELTNNTDKEIKVSGNAYRRVAKDKAKARVIQAYNQTVAAASAPYTGRGLVNVSFSPSKGIGIAPPDVMGLKTRNSKTKLLSEVASTLDDGPFEFMVPAKSKKAVYFLTDLKTKEPIFAIKYDINGKSVYLIQGLKESTAAVLLDSPENEKRAFIAGELTEKMAGLYFMGCDGKEASLTSHETKGGKLPTLHSEILVDTGSKMILMQDINGMPNVQDLILYKFTTKNQKVRDINYSMAMKFESKEVKPGMFEIKPSFPSKAQGDYAFRLRENKKEVMDFAV